MNIIMCNDLMMDEDILTSTAFEIMTLLPGILQYQVPYTCKLVLVLDWFQSANSVRTN